MFFTPIRVDSPASIVFPGPSMPTLLLSWKFPKENHLSSIGVSSPLATAGATRSWKSIVLVFCCTVIGAIAQMLIKTGANTITHKGIVDSLIGMVTNLPLFAGYCLYGISMVLLVLALRHGELSQLYPVIALTYVWVCLLSVAVLHEPMNLYKSTGVGFIVLGVAVLGGKVKK